MSEKLHQSNFHCNNSDIVLSIPHVAICSKITRRWHLAFTAIHCSRALLSLFHEILLKNGKTPSSPHPDAPFPTLLPSKFITKPRPGFDSSNVDKSILLALVKERNLGDLVRLGSVEGIASSLKTDLQLGLSGKDDDDDILRRKEAFGANMYRRAPVSNFLYFVHGACSDPTIIILLICALISLGFGIKENGIKEGWYDGGSIFVAVFLVVTVSSISDFRQSKLFNELSKISSNISVEVVRDGRHVEVSIFDVVVGDIICLKIGDQVPADGLLVEGQSLLVDESSMTGESKHVEVDKDRNPFLLSGTNVVDGYGKMVVTSVGMSTTWGEMMSMVSCHADEQTSLQMRLNWLASSIGKVGLAMAFLVLVVLLIRYFTGNTMDENGKKRFNGSKTKADDVINAVVGFVATAVTIVVVAIPEGLPLAVTLTLAYSMKKMMADNAMVRKLPACETMGSVTTICTDKTGTLTLNQMKVTKFWQGNVDHYMSLTSNVLNLLHQGVGLNTTGSVYKSKTNLEFSGSPTEKVILSWAVLELNMDMDVMKRDYKILHVETFNSEKKMSGVLVSKISDDNACHVHWKGAAEMVLAMCSHYYDCEGNMKALDSNKSVEFNQIIEGMAASSLRCVAFAHKQVSNNGETQKKIQDNGLVLVAIIGLKDPCRPGVKRAVEECQCAGVHVKMITGDNVFTAKAIAAECGILHPNHEANDESVIEGVEFRNYTEQERLDRIEKIHVMARSSPLDKLLMVQCLRKKGHVVAVTGDGTNDASALKEADIGLSMGIQGTEMAKQSSDIVILDDNFASVVTIIGWGRCVYNNIQKFIQFQLTVNVAAVVINFVAAVSSGEVPLTAVQLLWVNLIMDTLGALALATEKPTRELMERSPVGRTAPMISNVMWRNLVVQAVYQVVVLLVLQFEGESIMGVSNRKNKTMIFNTFVVCQVMNEFNARKMEKKNVFEGIVQSRVFMAVVGVTVVLQVVMVEFLNKFADTERLDWREWGICLGIAAVSWPLGWAVKFFPVPEKPLSQFMRRS